jgi:two-component system response regulator FlrC
VIEPQHLCFEAASAAAAAISATALPAAPPVPAATGSRLAGQLQHTEQQIIIDALRGSQGSRVSVAERLGISPRTLRYKLARMRAAGVELQAQLGSAA